MRLPFVCVGVALSIVGCGDDNGAGIDLAVVDLALPDQSLAGDLGAPDLAADDGSLNDAAPPDLFHCTPSAFLRCSGSTAIYCDTTGGSTTPIDCMGACTGVSNCGQCAPGTSTCASATESRCDSFGRKTTRACGLGCDGAGAACVTCIAGATSCQGATLQTCNADGNSVASHTCRLGCSAATGGGDGGALQPAHCLQLAPSNGLAIDCDAVSTRADLVISGLSTIDPDTGKIDGVLPMGADYSTVSQSGGPDIGVLHVHSLTVAAGARLRAAPSGLFGANKALAILADGDVTISGALDVASHLSVDLRSVTGGPGASSQGAGSAGVAVAFLPMFAGIGGGGGGYASSGGSGGNATGAVGAGGSPYPVSGDPHALIPLVGGGSGGAAAGGTASQGGGALQIVACGSVTVPAGGVVNAGGSGAPFSMGAPSGGTGGGAGGGILIEAPKVTVAGLLAANGGGGEGGGIGGASGAEGAAGGDASTDGTCAAGSGGGSGASSGGSSGGTGGAGACGATDAQPGLTGTPGGAGSPAVGHGGGGGGSGRIRLNSSTAPTVGATSMSPRLTDSYTTGALLLQ